MANPKSDLSLEERRKRNNERSRIYREANKERLAAQKKACYERNKASYLAKSAEWHKENPEKNSGYTKKYRTSHKAQISEYLQKYSENYRWRNQDKIAWMKCKRLKCIPAWVERSEIQRVYMGCPEGMEVDHIVPLRGADVRGLHVPWNLQYLSKSDNCRKNNRFKDGTQHEIDFSSVSNTTCPPAPGNH